MSKQTMKDALDGLAEAAVPEQVDLWPGVRARVQACVPGVPVGAKSNSAHVSVFWRLRGRLGVAGRGGGSPLGGGGPGPCPSPRVGEPVGSGGALTKRHAR